MNKEIFSSMRSKLAPDDSVVQKVIKQTAPQQTVSVINDTREPEAATPRAETVEIRKRRPLALVIAAVLMLSVGTFTAMKLMSRSDTKVESAEPEIITSADAAAGTEQPGDSQTAGDVGTMDIPEVAGMTESEAVEVLKNAGLLPVIKDTYDDTGEYPVGTVVKTNPSLRTSKPEVLVYVSRGKPGDQIDIDQINKASDKITMGMSMRDCFDIIKNTCGTFPGYFPTGEQFPELGSDVLILELGDYYLGFGVNYDVSGKGHTEEEMIDSASVWELGLIKKDGSLNVLLKPFARIEASDDSSPFKDTVYEGTADAIDAWHSIRNKNTKEEVRSLLGTPDVSDIDGDIYCFGSASLKAEYSNGLLTQIYISEGGLDEWRLISEQDVKTVSKSDVSDYIKLYTSFYQGFGFLINDEQRLSQSGQQNEQSDVSTESSDIISEVNPTETPDVPDVTGKTRGEAIEVLKNAGLLPVIKETYDDTGEYPENTVIKTALVGNLSGKEVIVYVSKGKFKRVISNVSEELEADIRRALEASDRIWVGMKYSECYRIMCSLADCCDIASPISSKTPEMSIIKGSADDLPVYATFSFGQAELRITLDGILDNNKIIDDDTKIYCVELMSKDNSFHLHLKPLFAPADSDAAYAGTESDYYDLSRALAAWVKIKDCLLREGVKNALGAPNVEEELSDTYYFGASGLRIIYNTNGSLKEYGILDGNIGIWHSLISQDIELCYNIDALKSGIDIYDNEYRHLMK